MLTLAAFMMTSFTACSKAESANKKDKSKKSKKVEEEAEEEEEEKAEPKKENEKAEAPKAAEEKPAEKVDFDALWADLLAGNKRFMSGKHTTINYATMRASLAKGQKPKVIVLGCADSRVPPEFLFDKNLGELFVVRDAGNIPDEVSLGSIEYAVEHLKAKMIVVLGHESCGAVAAAVSGEKMPTKNLTAIVETITPSFEGSKECPMGGEPNLACVALNVNHTAELLSSKSPVLKKAIEEKEIAVIPAVYHFDTGEVVRIQ